MLCSNCQSSLGGNLRECRVKGTHSSAPVTELEAEMALVEATMDELAERRTLLRRLINSLSPTAQLPPEILTEIFRTTCQMSETVTPLFFGSICKEWRDVAWSTPLLWNTISLHVSRKTHGSQVQLLGEWLSRANTSPLYIKLTSDDEHESIFCSLRAVMDVLVTRASFWHSLDCLLPPQCHDVLKNNHFPLLTSVSVRPPKGTISTFSEPPNMFLSAPKLLDVDLSGYNFSSMVLPWEQLRRFKTQFLTVAECLKVLRRSPNLKECHLESVYSPELLSSSTSEPFLSQLEHLDVTLIKGAAISLLDTITLPALCELRIHYSGPGGFLLSAVSSLVLRSGCTLQSLCVEKQNVYEDDLIACLEAMPALMHLRLVVLDNAVHQHHQQQQQHQQQSTSEMGLTDKVVGRLHPKHASGSLLLPKLVSLEYRGRVSCDSGVLVSVLVERWRSSCNGAEPGLCAKLTAAEIVAWPGGLVVPSDALEELSRLSREGMMVCLRSLDRLTLLP